MRPILPLIPIAALASAPGAQARPPLVTDASVPRELPGDGPVQVRWTDPAEFTELRQSRNRWEAARGNWVVTLAEHLQKSAAARLPEGQHMDITITDIQRAGSFEPWLMPDMQHVRMMRDIYPPRMNLGVRITGQDGQLVSEGQHRLSDMNYLHSTPPTINSSDPLRHEKHMIDTWVRRELPGPTTAHATR